MDFEWSGVGHVMGVILSCCMVISPSGVISVQKGAAALVVTFDCFTMHEEGDILSCNCRMTILSSNVISV